MTSLIEIEDATFGYGERPVLVDVNVRIGRGALVGVAGPNGSGKSTLVRGVLGLLRPTRGHVRRTARALGYVPQRDTLDPLFPLTALEVVRMGAYGRLAGLRLLAREDRARARAALERVGLGTRARRLFAELSGGQRQRVLLARALVMEPELLVLDEPTSGVDAEAEGSILALLRELRAEGMGILLVSHRLEALCEVADELLWIDARHVGRRAPAELLAALRAAPTRLAHGAQGNA